MTAVTVGTSEVAVTFNRRSAPIIQNLGTDNVYWSRTSGVTASSGVEVPADSSFQFNMALMESGGPVVYMIADAADQDVRVEPAPDSTS